MIESFLAGLRATSPLEAVAVILGLMYSVLAAARSRWCWVAGGVASAILSYLSAQANLPMQAALNGYYVVMAFYGYWRWSSERDSPARRVGVWPLRAHLVSWVAILTLSLVSARWLSTQTEAAWPFLDSATTWASLLATWLVARAKLENWAYWIVIDAVLVFLYARQGLTFISAQFVVYLVISVIGLRAWLKAYRQPAAAV